MGGRRRREELLRSLGSERTTTETEAEHEPIRVLYAGSLGPERARAVYDDLIATATRKHKKWMVASAAALPLAVPLTLIPGPNVLLGYLAWRSFVHYQVKRAGERASDAVVDFVPDERITELARLVDRWPFRARRKIRELGDALGLSRLDRAVRDLPGFAQRTLVRAQLRNPSCTGVAERQTRGT